MRGRTLAILAVALATNASTAAAVVTVTGTSSRTATGVAVTLKNTGSEEIRFLRLFFGVPYTAAPQTAPCQAGGPGEVFCPLAMGAFTPGGEFVVQTGVSPLLPDGTPIAGRASADGVTDVQFSVPGPTSAPPPPAGAPDIAVDLSGAATTTPGATVRYTLTISNVGTAMAAAGSVRVGFPRSGTRQIRSEISSHSKDPRAGAPIRGIDRDDEFTGEALTVPFPALAPGDRTTTTIDVEVDTDAAINLARSRFLILAFDDVGIRSLKARVVGADPEPGPNSDVLTTEFINVEPPVDSAIGRPAPAPREISGTASGSVDRVEVGVVRASGGARAAAPSCSWLAATRVTFRRTPAAAKRCRTPVWLKASGTKRWRLRLSRPLPRGSYVVYSRAVTGDDAHEVRFSAKDGNRVALTVR